MRAVKYSDNYELGLNLMVQDPGDGLITWEISAAIEAYISPFLSSLSNIATFNVTSQIQNYASIAAKPRGALLGDKTMYILSTSELKMFINADEWSLASAVSLDVPIHFVLYVPSKKQSPLHIVRSDGFSI